MDMQILLDQRIAVATSLQMFLPFAKDEHRARNAETLQHVLTQDIPIEDRRWAAVSSLSGIYTNIMRDKVLTEEQRRQLLKVVVWGCWYERLLRPQHLSQRFESLLGLLTGSSQDQDVLMQAIHPLMNLVPALYPGELQRLSNALPNWSFPQVVQCPICDRLVRSTSCFCGGCGGRLEGLPVISPAAKLSEVVAKQLASQSTPERPTLRRRWEQPFQKESDVINHFPEQIDRLSALASSLGPTVAQHLNETAYSRRQYQTYTMEGGTSNMFLAPAALVATKIASLLEAGGRYTEAFAVANAFGEMSKILVTRNRARYYEVFEGLLRIALRAASGIWSSTADQTQHTERDNEISALRDHLEKICQFALGTFFHDQAAEFRRNYQVDARYINRLVSTVLAMHFDRHLRQLLEVDRPSVTTYIRNNMPVVYRLELGNQWNIPISEWEHLLVNAGFEDVLREMKGTGLLTRSDTVGQIPKEQLDEIRRAAGANDLARVRELLKPIAEELRAYLYREAQSRLDYCPPPPPHFQNQNLANGFRSARHLVERGDSASLQQALEQLQRVWEQEINNMGIRDWVAYLYARTNNRPAAERELSRIRGSRDSRHNFTTDWNYAVLLYEGKDEQSAYQVLAPLLEHHAAHEALILVMLALSLKLNDRERFLATVPRTGSVRYHPLAVVVAYEIETGERARTKAFLAPLLSVGGWQLPPASERFARVQEFDQVVNRAIVEGKVDLLVPWLEERIRLMRGWVYNYTALAKVLEQERGDIDGAFKVLQRRLDQVRSRTPRVDEYVDQACRDLLELCRRQKRQDLGTRAYESCKRADADGDLLQSFASFAPPSVTDEQPDDPQPPQSPPLTLPPDGIPNPSPQLTERLAWVTAGLSRIRTVALYVQETRIIDGLCAIINEIAPVESQTVVKIIEDVTTLIKTFAHTDVDDHDQRKVLYERTVNYEQRLTALVTTGALTTSVTNILTPYNNVLKQIVGDLSRQAGIGPNIEANIVNPFISLQKPRSTLVLQITNRSDRPASTIRVELLTDHPAISVVRRRERSTLVAALEAKQSRLLSFPLEISDTIGNGHASEVGFNISIHASAEGFPNTDLGITKRQVPVKQLQTVIGYEQIPRLFQSGKPLHPSHPTLFQGREEILTTIRDSFFDDVQTERFFLDGIRRVGKTSILNFLPQSLPDSVLPVLINLDLFGLSGPIDTGGFLHQLTEAMRDSAQAMTGAQIEIADLATFQQNPRHTFHTALMAFKSRLPSKTPFLMVDEFQELLWAVARSGSDGTQDTVVLDLIRGYADEGKLYVLFTGSIRFDRLSTIVRSRLFGALTRKRVSFLSEASVGKVLSAGVRDWAIIPTETTRRVYELTGGYPWLVQTYGAGLVDTMNREHRTVATPDDVEMVTQEVLSNPELFEHWWSSDQLGVDEERVIETLFRSMQDVQPISTQQFLDSVSFRERETFQNALTNLRACEVLDSTQPHQVRFSGGVLYRWLRQQYDDDGRLRISNWQTKPSERGQAGIFIDHENLYKTLERIAQARGVPTNDRPAWFSAALNRLVEQASTRIGPLTYRIAVAFWDRPVEAVLSRAYHNHGFRLPLPETAKPENAVDFKLVDAVHESIAQALRENMRLTQVIIVTGDGDLSHTVRTLTNSGVGVQVWGGSRETSEIYRSLVGPKNVVVLDDLVGF